LSRNIARTSSTAPLTGTTAPVVVVTQIRRELPCQSIPVDRCLEPEVRQADDLGLPDADLGNPTFFRERHHCCEVGGLLRPVITLFDLGTDVAAGVVPVGWVVLRHFVDVGQRHRLMMSGAL
jgi:hypothetical protein